MVKIENQGNLVQPTGSICCLLNLCWILNAWLLVRIMVGLVSIVSHFKPCCTAPFSSKFWPTEKSETVQSNEKQIPVFAIFYSEIIVCSHARMRWYRAIPSALYSVSPNGDIFPNYSTTSEPGCCHCYRTFPSQASLMLSFYKPLFSHPHPMNPRWYLIYSFL